MKPDFDKILEKESVYIAEAKHHYHLPVYRVEPGKGIVQTDRFLDLKFVRGNKEVDMAGYKDGTLHEHLLATMIYDLSEKYKEVKSSHTAKVIEKLYEAQFWLRERQVDRTTRDVQGTYKP